MVAVAVALAGSPARAGIVNVQSILATKADEGLSGSITSSLDLRQGNSNRFLFSVAPSARYKRGDHLAIAVAKGEIVLIGRPCEVGEGDPDDTCYDRQDRTVFEHLRYRYTVSDRIIGEAFVQHEYNETKRLGLRALFGVGPRVQVYDTQRLQVGVGVAYMFEYERLQNGYVNEPGSTEDTAVNHRLSSYVTGSYELDDRVQLVETVYAQPRVTSPGDIRLLNESQLVVKLSKALSLTTSLILAYDSEPPAAEGDGDEVEPLDIMLKASITYSF